MADLPTPAQIAGGLPPAPGLVEVRDFDAEIAALPTLYAFKLGGEVFEVADIDPTILVKYMELITSSAEANSVEAWTMVQEFLGAAVRPHQAESFIPAFTRARPGLRIVLAICADIIEKVSGRPTVPPSS
jgi:hypothetical protein